MFVFYFPPPALPRGALAEPPAPSAGLPHGQPGAAGSPERGPPGEAGPGAARAAAAQLSAAGAGPLQPRAGRGEGEEGRGPPY